MYRGIVTLYSALPSSPTENEHDETTIRTVGLSLLAGFALMLLIESLMPHPPQPAADDEEITPINTPRRSDSDDRPSVQHLDSQSPIIPKRMHVHDGEARQSGTSGVAGLNATLGLVIHGAADGIALGASSLSGKGRLGFIIFLAVLVHKGEHSRIQRESLALTRQARPLSASRRRSSHSDCPLPPSGTASSSSPSPPPWAQSSPSSPSSLPDGATPAVHPAKSTRSAGGPASPCSFP